MPDVASIDSTFLLELARGLVRFPSQIPNEGAIAEFLAGEMRKRGTFDEVILQPLVAGRPNVIGVLHGTGHGRNVLLNGHLDIPPPNGKWNHDPYTPSVEDGWLYGLGVSDMKGGVACQVACIDAIARSGVRPAGDIVLTAVVHHDTSGLGTKFFLDSWDRPIHAAINGEPTDLKIQVAHGGAWQFELNTRGRAAHISRVESGVNAIDKMQRLLAKLDVSRLSFKPNPLYEGLPRLVVGLIEGGRAPGRTADVCTIRGDIRTLPGMSQETLVADLQRLIDELRRDDPDFEADVRGLVYQRPFHVDPEEEIVRLVRQAHERVTGQKAEVSAGLPPSAFVTDSSDLARLGIPTAIYGPGDWRIDPDERIRIDDMTTAATVYAHAALSFANAANS